MTDQNLPGCFITLEGSEGVGKSTNLAFIRQWLEAQAVPHLITREPGGTPLAEQIREMLLAPREERFSHKAELLLMFAARAQHLDYKIIPALERGICVVSDRFTDATYAYQGAARGVNMSWIRQLEQLVQETLQPDLTLLLDLPTEIARERMDRRGTTDRFEQEQTDFFNRVRDGYLERAGQEPKRFAVIDAGQTLGKVQQDIAETLQAFFATRAFRQPL